MVQSKSFFWPLMVNNVERDDLNQLIDYLKQDDPKLTHGPKVREFEEAWSKWLGVKYSVMLNSGSSANDLTLLALKYLVGEGEVIVPPLTWVSDISSVIRAGFKPIFIDIEMNSLAIDSKKLKEKINSKTKAIFLTHSKDFRHIYIGCTQSDCNSEKNQNDWTYFTRSPCRES